jgi:transaldolase
MNDRLKALADAGVSIWLDDLSRQRLTSGSLAQLIEDKHVVGVTTNPTIFAKAISDADAYADQVTRLGAEGVSVDQAIRVITTDDVRDAADVYKPVYDDTEGQDGRVSIEVEPSLARDTEKTNRQPRQLREADGRENVFVKIPAT